jgi:hypothetical protein
MWGEAFAGSIDEVRVYRRALTAGEIQTDMSTAIVGAVTDSQAPSAPGTLTATGGLGQVQLSWGAASDNVGVTKYNVYRAATAGFTPSTSNRIAQPTGTSYSDTSLTPGTWFYRVTAQDAAGNVGPASNEASATATSDTTPPTVSVTAPAAGATVTGTINLNSTASDNVAVAGVQFKVDGNDVGSEDTTSPYSVTWDTLTATAGSHTITAVARDGAGNRTTSAGVTVTVNNPPVDTSGLVAAYGFEEGTGATVTDSSTAHNNGTISGAAWTDQGRFGNALSFDGIDDIVSVPDADSLDASDQLTVEAWVKPAQHGAWHNVVMKEKSGGQMAYGMYATAWTDFPSAHVNTSGEDSTRGTAQLPTNSWSHLAMTYDGTRIRLYVNARLVGTTLQRGPIARSWQPLLIGNDLCGNWFDGLIDEVRVYDRALSASEIQLDLATPLIPTD